MSKSSPENQQHFCEDARETVCGWSLLPIGSDRFHRHTTNSFAQVTCEGCRTWLRENRLKAGRAGSLITAPPGGFPDPQEWAPV